MTKSSILSTLFFCLLCPSVGLTLGSDTYSGTPPPNMGPAPEEMGKAMSTPPAAPASNQPVQSQAERSIQSEQKPDRTGKPIEKNIERGVGQEIDSGPSKTNEGLREGLEEPPAGMGKQPKAAANPPNGQTSTNKEAAKPIDTYIRGY